MKKYVILFLLSFFSLLMEVNAKTDWSVGTLTCNYKKDNDIVSITYYNVGAALGEADVYYSVSKIVDNKTYCFTSSLISKCSNETVSWFTMGIYNYNSSFSLDGQQFYDIKSRLTRSGYNEETNFNEDELCSAAVLITDIGNDSMDDIILCETNKNKIECNYNNSDLYTLSSKTIGVSPYAGANTTDYQDAYIQNKKEQEEYCKEEYIKKNGDKDCEEAKNDVNATTEEAEKRETTEQQLATSYENYKLYQSEKEFTASDCNTILGDIKNENTPAYYLNFAFNLIKYIAIVLLLVLTTVDFAKASASSDNDALKKALKKAVKRLIICVIIFFLPTFINFVLRLFGLVDGATCGIGG